MTAALFALIHHPYFYGLQKVGLQLKIAASGMLVNKVGSFILEREHKHLGSLASGFVLRVSGHYKITMFAYR